VQSNGDTEFNEVFLTGVRVPGDEVVGEPGQGWEIAMTTVGYERGPADVGFSSRYVRTSASWWRPRVRGHPRLPAGRSTWPGPRGRAGCCGPCAAGASRRARRHTAGPEGSIDKLLATRSSSCSTTWPSTSRARRLTGTETGGAGEYLYSRATSIAGGSSQIQAPSSPERLLDSPGPADPVHRPTPDLVELVMSHAHRCVHSPSVRGLVGKRVWQVGTVRSGGVGEGDATADGVELDGHRRADGDGVVFAADDVGEQVPTLGHRHDGRRVRHTNAGVCGRHTTVQL